MVTDEGKFVAVTHNDMINNKMMDKEILWNLVG